MCGETNRRLGGPRDGETSTRFDPDQNDAAKDRVPAPVSSPQDKDDLFAALGSGESWDDTEVLGREEDPVQREPRRHSVVDKLQEVARKESRDRAGPRPRKGLLILLILVTTAVSLGIVIGLTQESPLRVIPEMVVLLTVLFIGQGGAWLVYEKADISGWLSLVPVVNVWYLHEIAGVWKPLIVVWLIPFLNLIIMFVVFYGVARNFGRGVVFALGLMFAPVIFFPMLGFGNFEYRDIYDRTAIWRGK